MEILIYLNFFHFLTVFLGCFDRFFGFFLGFSWFLTVSSRYLPLFAISTVSIKNSRLVFGSTSIKGGI
jgi:hypothetical protein